MEFCSCTPTKLTRDLLGRFDPLNGVNARQTTTQKSWSQCKPINTAQRPSISFRPETGLRSLRGGIFKSFVRFYISPPFLDIIDATLANPPRRILLVTLTHCRCRAWAFEGNKQMHCRSKSFCQRRKSCISENYRPGLFFWMNDVENYQKANQNLFHRDGVLYLIELFSKIADRLVFCMFDIKLLIFTQSQDILLIFSQRQKTALARFK